MTKRYVKVEVLCMDGSTTVTYDDSVDAGSGSTAANQFEAHETLKAPVTGNNVTAIVAVPFHAVLKATITYTTATVDAPSDAVCQ